MKTNLIMSGALALLLLAGCKNEGPTASNDSAGTASTSASASSTSTVSPEALGEIGAKIKAHPADAHKILSDQGMTEAQFETAIRSVSSDPALSRRYADAYKKAKG